MDQEKFVDKIQEEILNRLPAEAVQKLSDLSDDSENQEEVAKVLRENNINIEEIAHNLMEGEG